MTLFTIYADYVGYCVRGDGPTVAGRRFRRFQYVRMAETGVKKPELGFIYGLNSKVSKSCL